MTDDVYEKLWQETKEKTQKVKKNEKKSIFRTEKNENGDN